jgi:hypothetical protein
MDADARGWEDFVICENLRLSVANQLSSFELIRAIRGFFSADLAVSARIG